MTYREAFDATGNRRPQQSLRRHYRAVLLRWLGAVALLLAWAALTGWMDGPK